MKNSFLKFSLVFITSISSCFFCFAKTAITPQPSAAISDKDSITVNGKILPPCHIPDKIKIWKFNVMDRIINSVEIPVSKSGEFTYTLPLNEPHQVSIKVDQTNLDFIATPKEKIYNLEVSLDNRRQKKLEVKDSYENQAFLELYNLTKALKDSLSNFSKFNIARKDTFQIIRKLFLEYQVAVTGITKRNQESFTAHVLCPAVLLPESAFSSIEALRENYLQRDALSNLLFYNCNLMSYYITDNYFDLRDKKDTSFSCIRTALEIGCRNPKAAVFLEQIFYYLLFNQRKEELLASYINWAKNNPDKMYNMVVKMQLKNLESCIAGAPYSEVILNDPDSIPRKLSETVASAKITLLIFYSPTCSHCQETLPKIVPLWNKYKNKGLKIYAVADGSTSEEWNNFIKTKTTGEWTNVFEAIYSYRPSSKYVVNSIPAFVLINHEGKIITRFANLEYLSEEIPKLLGE